jgi:hypothetical protein
VRLATPLRFLLVISLLALVGCDWLPGSQLRWSHSVRTWEELTSGECLTLGTYIWAINASTPPFRGTTSLKVRPEFKDQREFLPTNLDLNWYLNDALTPTYQQAFELKNGRAKLREEVGVTWSYLAGDELRYEICVGGGTLPLHSEIGYSLRWKFDKD